MVEAQSDGLSLQGGLFGIGRKRWFAADQVKKITSSLSIGVGTKTWNNIIVVLQGDKQRTIAQTIEGQLAKQAVIDEINAALRRKQPA